MKHSMIKGLVLWTHATSGSGHQLIQVSLVFDHWAVSFLPGWFDRTGRPNGGGKANLASLTQVQSRIETTIRLEDL